MSLQRSMWVSLLVLLAATVAAAAAADVAALQVSGRPTSPRELVSSNTVGGVRVSGEGQKKRRGGGGGRRRREGGGDCKKICKIQYILRALPGTRIFRSKKRKRKRYFIDML